MRLLILFSMWVPDQSENSKNWIDYYVSAMHNNFDGDDKFFAINGNEHAINKDQIRSLRNVVGISTVPDGMIISSDASGYQHALRECDSILSNYDAVCFFHSKGVSYNFDHMGHMRQGLDGSVFDRPRLVDGLSNDPASLTAITGFVSPSAVANRSFSRLEARCGVENPSVHFCASFTLYAVRSKVLIDLMNSLPEEYKNQNLNSVGVDRYFFEGSFPSLLGSKGAVPHFLSGEELSGSVNEDASFDALPSHNAALVSKEFREKKKLGPNYTPIALPYVFCPADKIADKEIRVIFDQRRI